MTAMDVPGKPAKPTVVTSGEDVVITWATPFTGGSGVALTSFTITFKDSADDYIELPECPGTNPATLTCSVDMQVFTTTLGLSFDDLI